VLLALKEWEYILKTEWYLQSYKKLFEKMLQPLLSALLYFSLNIFLCILYCVTSGLYLVSRKNWKIAS